LRDRAVLHSETDYPFHYPFVALSCTCGPLGYLPRFGHIRQHRISISVLIAVHERLRVLPPADRCNIHQRQMLSL
jgi:hypothetical protein